MEDKDRTQLASICAGILFGIGWWLLGDAAGYATYTDDLSVQFVYVLPGLFCTVALILLNVFSWSDLQGGGLEEGNTRRAKCLLFTSILFMFGCVVGALWILISIYASKSSSSRSSWPGVAIVLQNIFIILSAITLRFGRAQQSI